MRDPMRTWGVDTRIPQNGNFWTHDIPWSLYLYIYILMFLLILYAYKYYHCIIIIMPGIIHVASSLRAPGPSRSRSSRVFDLPPAMDLCHVKIGSFRRRGPYQPYLSSGSLATATSPWVRFKVSITLHGSYIFSRWRATDMKLVPSKYANLSSAVLVLNWH